MFDKKRLKKFIGFILLLILIIAMILILQDIFGRYRSVGTSSTDVEIAFFAVQDTYQEGNIFLADLYPTPKEAPFEYIFTVSNFDGTNTAETAIEYSLTLEATTNLPLEFEIEKKTNNGNFRKLSEGTNVNTNLILDNTGENYLKKVDILNGEFDYNEQTTDTYKINVEFPLEYANNPELADMIDNIKISLDARQKLEG